MSAPTNTKKLAATAAPKVVVRRSAKRVIVTAEMMRQLRANARVSTRTDFPELPEWRRKER
ncbi:hypothetical protein DEE44_11415 [Ralstonia pickettii]|jgi:hypothetical protein|uniref:Uncharacterized protein n=2 Tax=Ralstonia pickettii TaxID=329 RepID=A0ABM9IPD9_RALPI|nr:hypothetical protein [Ralstonia pickettii]MBA9882663.1 hypothetical protein [Ralstonia pickettii]MBA9892779.1 hypothetical protein [Ralstonia pickettii]MBA9924524.1 hypothetical protein [Ralstonia pickettii]MBA9963890.1 hypothetical protein [Ralstonia pickettii]MBB0093097.1 hypothetical protein [Ralstonia pickettii]